MNGELAIRELCADCFELSGELTRDTVPALWQERHRICGGDSKVVINGSAVHVTAAFGMALAGLVLQDARRRAREEALPERA